MHMLKPKVTFDKPVIVGQAVLHVDYSKIGMYNLFYHLLPECPLIKKLQLIGEDTDSFFLNIVTDTHITLSDVFNNLAQHIDTSNYPPSHPKSGKIWWQVGSSNVMSVGLKVIVNLERNTMIFQ